MLKKQKIKLGIGIGLVSSIVFAGAILISIKSITNKEKHNVNFSIALPDKNSLKNNIRDVNGKWFTSPGNSFEDGVFERQKSINSAKTKVQYLKAINDIVDKYNMHNGNVRIVNYQDIHGVKIEAILRQIYSIETQSDNDDYSIAATGKLKTNNVYDTYNLIQKLQDNETKKFFTDLFIGAYVIDWVSQGARTGINDHYLINKKDIINKIWSSKDQDVLNVLNKLELATNIKSLYNDPNNRTKGFKILSGNLLSQRLLEDVNGNKLIKDNSDFKTYFDKSNNSISKALTGSYSYFPTTEKQQWFFEAMRENDIKLEFSSVPLEKTIGKGNISVGWANQEWQKIEDERMGVDWITINKNRWLDDNYGSGNNNMAQPNSLRKLSDERSDKKYNFTPQGWANDDRVISEMAPYWARYYRQIATWNNRIFAFDTNNEPNIDITWGHNYGLNPRQYADLSKNFINLLQDSTKGLQVQLDNHSANPQDIQTDGTRLKTNTINLTYHMGMRVPLTLNSHSRVGADKHFAMWESNRNSESNKQKLGVKEYIRQAYKVWPSIIENAIFTYHLYWDFDPGVLEDVYKFVNGKSTEKTEDKNIKIRNTTFDYKLGLLPLTGNGQNHAHLPRYDAMSTEASYNFAPDWWNYGYGAGGMWKLNSGAFVNGYQYHFHSQETQLASFMPYDIYHSKDAEKIKEENLKNGIKYHGSEDSPGMTSYQHINRMVDPGDRYLKEISKSFEQHDKQIIGDVWINQDATKLKLFIMNDGENMKSLHIKFNGLNDMQVVNFPDNQAAQGTSSERISLINGVSVIPHVGMQYANPAKNQIWKEVKSANSHIQFKNQILNIANLKPWSFYSVILDIS